MKINRVKVDPVTVEKRCPLAGRVESKFPSFTRAEVSSTFAASLNTESSQLLTALAFVTSRCDYHGHGFGTVEATSSMLMSVAPQMLWVMVSNNKQTYERKEGNE